MRQANTLFNDIIMTETEQVTKHVEDIPIIRVRLLVAVDHHRAFWFHCYPFLENSKEKDEKLVNGNRFLVNAGFDIARHSS